MSSEESKTFRDQDINVLWAYLCEKYIEYTTKLKSGEQLPLAYDALTKIYPDSRIHKQLALKRRFLNKIFECMMEIWSNSYESVIRLIIQYSNTCPDELSDYHDKIRAQVSRLKHYGLLINNPRKTLCQRIMCWNCGKFSLQNNTCQECIKRLNCTWKFAVAGYSKCSCGQSMFRWNLWMISIDDWINRQEDEILGDYNHHPEHNKY